MARSAYAIAAFLILGPGSARAADADSTRAERQAVLTLPAVEVLAPRPHSDSLLRVTPGFAQGYDVSRARGRALMVSDLLAGAVGVHIRELGAAGSFATASIRGSTPAQVAVYLDGVPLNQAQYGVVNVADLPLEALDQVEVFRGAAPITLESPGGGAINLVTTARVGRWVRASGGMGSFGTARGDVGMGWQSGRWGALLVAQALQSQGDYLFDDDNATPFNPDDDEIATRLNNWTRTAGLTARVSTELGPVGVSLTHDLLRKRYGVPGIGANQVLASTMETDRDLSSLLVEHRRGHGAGARPGASVRLFGTWHRDRFADPEGKLTGVRQASDDHTDRGGASTAIPLVVPGQHRLTFVGEVRRERYQPHIVFPTPRTLAESRRDVLAWGIEDHWTVPALRLAVLASWRRTETRDSFPPGPAYPGALPSPSVSRTLVLDRPSVGVTVDLFHGLALKASFTELARAPTLEELFGNRAGVYGNPRALPEHVTTGDIGIIGHGSYPASTWLPSMIEIQASAWRSNARDLLVYVPNSLRAMVATNVSAARLWGLEWDGRFMWRSGLTVQSSWTRQWTRDEGEIVYWNGRELPSRPRDEIAVQTALTRRRWRAFYDLHFVAANWLDRYNTDLAEQRTIHDVGLGLRVPFTAVEWTAECRNVSDVRVQDYAGFPLPGRTYYAGLAVQIHSRE